MKPAIRQVPRMDGLQNESGPAEVAASPSHGSSKTQAGIEMNSIDTITAAPAVSRDFPIPYAGQDPTDDLFAARAFLRVVQGAIERAGGNPRGMHKSEAVDMLHVIGLVAEHLETLQRLLDDKDVPNLAKVYERVRRAEILERSEVAA